MTVFATPNAPMNIPAKDWNDLGAMLAEWRANQAMGGTYPTRMTPNHIVVDLVSHRSISAYEVVGIDQPAHPPDVRLIDFQSPIPIIHSMDPKSDKPIAIVVQPTSEVGDIAKGIIFGATALEIDIKNDTDYFADIVESNGVTAIESNVSNGPLRILWHSPGRLGKQWCYVMIGGGDGIGDEIWFAHFNEMVTDAGIYTVHKASVHRVWDWWWNEAKYEDNVLEDQLVMIPWGGSLGYSDYAQGGWYKPFPVVRRGTYGAGVNMKAVWLPVALDGILVDQAMEKHIKGYHEN